MSDMYNICPLDGMEKKPNQNGKLLALISTSAAPRLAPDHHQIDPKTIHRGPVINLIKIVGHLTAAGDG